MADYNNEEKVFADGFSFKRQENAPGIVRQIVVKVMRR